MNNSFNYEQELTRTGEFLKKYQGIWSYEVLNEYPSGLNNFKKEWIEYLRELSPQEQWQIECRLGQFQGSLPDTFKEIMSHENLPKLCDQDEEQYPSWAFQKVSQKKEHEIKKIIALLGKSKEIKNKKILDIGGGAGHLARILALYHGAHVTSLDTNEEFQKSGKVRLDKYPKPEGAGSLTFLNHHFSADREKEKKLLADSDISLGLHTCGPLALEHLNLVQTKQNAKIINFGCCYQKLNINRDTMLSKKAQEIELNFTKYALTLATRGNLTISQNDFELKKKVKLYRAALHLYLSEKHDIHLFESVGSASPKVYRSEFSTYAKEKLPNGLKKIITDTELDNFYKSEKTQKTITTIYLANIIRWQFSRCLEKYLLLDRVLWLREKGIEANLLQVFAPQISPRNVALICNF